MSSTTRARPTAAPTAAETGNAPGASTVVQTGEGATPPVGVTLDELLDLWHAQPNLYRPVLYCCRSIGRMCGTTLGTVELQAGITSWDVLRQLARRVDGATDVMARLGILSTARPTYTPWVDIELDDAMLSAILQSSPSQQQHKSEDAEKAAMRAELAALKARDGQATVSSDPFTLARQMIKEADERAEKQLARMQELFEKQLDRVTQAAARPSTPAADLGREVWQELGELRALRTAPRGADISGIITAFMPALQRAADIADKIATARVEESTARVAVMTAKNRDALLAAGYQLQDDDADKDKRVDEVTADVVKKETEAA